MPGIKNIIFDLGGVIFHLDHALSHIEFEKIGIKGTEDHFGLKKQGELLDRLDIGAILPGEFYDGIREMTQKNIPDEQLEHAFTALLIGIPDVAYFDILLEYKNNYRTFLLSNNNRIHYNKIIDYLQGSWRLPSLSPFFEKEYYSHLLGMRKPNKEIFEHVLKEQGLIAEETLFIDDSPQHIETASSIGMHTYLKKQEEHLGKVLDMALKSV